MKIRSLAVAALPWFLFIAPVTGASAQDHHHHDASATDTTPASPVPAKRYTPDTPLRAGMRSVHRNVAELADAGSGQPDAAMITDHAAAIEAAVVGMFASCKLEPTPDAALHGILVPLLGQAQALKANPADTAPIAVMRSLIAMYPRYFDDPGWDAPAGTAR